jgi:hypothetical protein
MRTGRQLPVLYSGEGGAMSKIKNPELYRIELSCQIGKDAIDGKTNLNTSVDRIDFAVYNLLSAMQDLAAYLDRKASEQ